MLLKSIAMALPVYAMSCFRLSKLLCKKLTSAMTEFWWSSCENKRKISWVAWQKLCKSKEDDGGLGFRDLGWFNQALLAKQSFRIIHQPHTLLSRLLRSRYFPHSSMMECSVGTRPSYAWRSIIHGRELLSRGLLRTIGDGIHTKVWLDRWIMDETPLPPLN